MISDELNLIFYSLSVSGPTSISEYQDELLPGGKLLWISGLASYVIDETQTLWNLDNTDFGWATMLKRRTWFKFEGFLQEKMDNMWWNLPLQWVCVVDIFTPVSLNECWIEM